jgi:uracil-DNA glycosylase
LDGRKVLLTFHPSGLHYGHATPADLAGDLAKAYELALTR